MAIPAGKHGGMKAEKGGKDWHETRIGKQVFITAHPNEITAVAAEENRYIEMGHAIGEWMRKQLVCKMILGIDFNTTIEREWEGRTGLGDLNHLRSHNKHSRDK